ncbi:MAG: CocE/NonD family hydrolase [Pseudomonadota bacterium]
MVKVAILPDVGIPLTDGTRLSARVWRPDSTTPLPAILEYLPYRKSDGTALRDYPMHQHYAENGYVAVRVDRRGCGDSEGFFDDEYSEEELRDGEEIIAWIAAQDWCDGKVGIQGISWGGFNGLQLAARAPAALKAVISIGSTVDRYADDIHYKGGIQLGENLGWAATVLSWFSMPPDPQIVGETWRETWMERLHATPFLAERWTAHTDRDAYWQHGSVCEDYAAITSPVLAMGGLHDGYRNTMAHLVGNLSAPVQGIAGPWNHKYPHITTIAPGIDFLNLAVRWWDRWLKVRDNHADQDPAYRAYVMDSITPVDILTERPGRWVSMTKAPTRGGAIPFGDGLIGATAAFAITLPSDLSCGRDCGEYFPFGFGGGELPGEQSHDDARSACFDAQPVSESTDIVGAPEVGLTLQSDGQKGQVVVRLCDVAPGGTSSLITLGLLNLRHRGGFDKAVDLVPGESFEVSVTLDQCAYRLPAGHHLRVSLSTSYWPYCWPEGQEFSLTVTSGFLALPKADIAEDPGFDPPIPVEERPQTVLQEGAATKDYVVDPDTGQITTTIYGDQGRILDGLNDLITHSDRTEVWTIRPDDPTSAHVIITWNRTLARDGEFEVKTTAVAEMWGHAETFEIRTQLTAWDGEEQVFDREDHANVPR